jgi:hypothetical protein
MVTEDISRESQESYSARRAARSHKINATSPPHISVATPPLPAEVASMTRVVRLIPAIAIVFFGVTALKAQEGKPAASPPPELTIKNVAVYSGGGAWCPKPTPPPTPSTVTQPAATTAATPSKEICKAGIGDRVIVEVGGLNENVKAGVLKPADLVLFLNGRPLAKVNAIPAGASDSNWVAFDLKRSEESSEAWAALLGRPGFQEYRAATVSVGFPDKQAVKPESNLTQATISLRLYHRGWAIFALLALLVTIGLFFYLAKRTGIIRDSGPSKVAATDRPYSLAKIQAAFWFFLVIGSFIFLYLITGDYNTITEQALILMGIGTGTALGAAMIDANKNEAANDSLNELEPQQARLQSEVAELTKQQSDLQAKIASAGAAATDADKQTLSTTATNLSEKQAELTAVTNKINTAASGLTKPVTEGFRSDLLTDANGINFHRFQMVAWTLILGFLFIVGVYKALSMPQFSGTLLALMGISSGTYLGFKIPEKQS